MRFTSAEAEEDDEGSAISTSPSADEDGLKAFKALFLANPM